MDNSILKEMKKLIGITGEYSAFDTDIKLHINAAFAVLNQLGVGPDAPFMITGYDEQWGDFMMDERLIPLVKEYVYLKIKKVFDGATLNSYVLSSIDAQIAEYEFRLNVACDTRESDRRVSRNHANYPIRPPIRTDSTEEVVHYD